ncbi:hypothetical protein [Nitrosomonas sp. Nm34]
MPPYSPDLNDIEPK